MNIRAVLLASGLVVVGAIVSSANSGCGDDEATSSIPSRLARKGEACQTTNDCSAGLACLPSSNSAVGICVLGVFNVTLTAKECAIIECQEAKDCCDDPPSNCTFLKDSCDQQKGDGGLGTSGTVPSSCTQYDQFCVCNADSRDCEKGKCVVKCTTDLSCAASGSGGKCLGGKCGQCAGDDDCKKGDPNSDLTCVNGSCKAPCQGDGDCPNFDRCLQGKCVDSGCQTNRECVSATRNVEATCGTDGKCIVPCQTDLECGNPKGYSFFSCVSGQCLYMGCESDKDCRLLLTGTTSSSSTSSTSSTSSSTSSSSSSGGSSSGGLGFSSKQHVVCREKASPNLTTKPAK